MKRIVAYIEKKISEKKSENRENRIMNALNEATYAATDKLIEATERRETIMKRLSEDTFDSKKFVADLNDCFNDIQEAEAEKTRIEDIKKYLEEDTEEEK